MGDAYLCDGDLYCDDCAEGSGDPYPDGGGEADTPQNCAQCHRPLGNSLTAEGVDYVLNKMREKLREGRETYMQVHDCYNGTYYEGSPQIAIVRDWAEQLTWYALTGRDKRFVELFLSVTDKERGTP